MRIVITRAHLHVAMMMLCAMLCLSTAIDGSLFWSAAFLGASLRFMYRIIGGLRAEGDA